MVVHVALTAAASYERHLAASSLATQNLMVVPRQPELLSNPWRCDAV
jgi:hypothetical protein